MRTGKKTIIPIHIPIVLVILVILTVNSAGCIKIAQNALGGDKTGSPNSSTISTDSQAGSMAVIPQSTPTSPAIEVPSPTITDSVMEFFPQPTPAPYVTPNETRINSTPVDYLSFLNRQPEFTKTFIMEGYPVGLLVNVTRGPLYVVFTVNPAIDCLQNPASCAGTDAAPSNPYMTITVLDNQTNETVAEDGYGGIFSSDTGNYNNCNAQSNNGQSSGTISNTYSWVPNDNVCSQSGPRYIKVYRSGQFQIILNGNYLDVTVSVITGSSPQVTPSVTAGDDDS